MVDVKEKTEQQVAREGAPLDSFMFAQGALMRAARAAFHRRVGMSDARLHMLGILARFGEMSQNELQRGLDIGGAAVTRQVKQLESEGLLSRRPDPADNRFTLVTLTPQGGEMLQAVGRAAREFVADALDGISEEDLACVRRTMEHMRANIEKM